MVSSLFSKIFSIIIVLIASAHVAMAALIPTASSAIATKSITVTTSITTTTAITAITPTSAISTATSDVLLDADGIEFDGLKNTILASGNVVIKYKDIVIKSKEGEYFHQDKIVKLSGSVSLIKDKIKLTCKRLVANLKENKISAMDNVQFTFLDGIKGKSDIATYIMDKNMIILSGNASASYRDDKISGQEIVVLINEKKIITKGRMNILISPERY